MKGLNFILLSRLIIVFIIFSSCRISNLLIPYSPILRYSCDLISKVNDTISIEGIYSTCIEHSSFSTIYKDKCQANFQMELNLSDPSLDKTITKAIEDMHVCNATRRLVLWGILKQDGPYGHLGSNNSEFMVIKFIEIDEIVYK